MPKLSELLTQEEISTIANQVVFKEENPAETQLQGPPITGHGMANEAKILRAGFRVIKLGEDGHFFIL